MYVNHKPATNYTQEDLFKALDDVFEAGHQDVELQGTGSDDGIVQKDRLQALLQLYGEAFTEDELSTAFGELLKFNKKYKTLPEEFSKKELVEEILGLEPCIEAEKIQLEQEGMPAIEQEL